MQFVVIPSDDLNSHAESDGHPEADLSGFPNRILLAVLAISSAVSAVIVTMYTSASPS